MGDGFCDLPPRVFDFDGVSDRRSVDSEGFRKVCLMGALSNCASVSGSRTSSSSELPALAILRGKATRKREQEDITSINPNDSFNCFIHLLRLTYY